MECSDAYELVKISDICEIKRGTRFTKNNDNLSNLPNDTKKHIVPVYGAGSIMGYTNKKPNRSGFNCIIARVGGINSTNCCKLISGDM